MEFKLNTLTISQVQKVYSSYLTDQKQNQCFMKIAEKYMLKFDYVQALACLKKVNKSNLSNEEEDIYYQNLIDVYLKTGNYAGVYDLSKSLPEKHKLLVVSKESVVRKILG